MKHGQLVCKNKMSSLVSTLLSNGVISTNCRI